VTLLAAEGDTAALRLAPGTDDQSVLQAALAAGPVTEFSWRKPDLVELFRHVVTTGEAA
jgi:ABC-2 type transport system ATP-binding protein